MYSLGVCTEVPVGYQALSWVLEIQQETKMPTLSG